MNKNTGKELVDLHVHTSYSDGVFPPERVVQEALRLGLKAVAITDHDCVDGIEPSIDAARDTSLEIIPGVEISSVKKDTEIHILGYFIDWRETALVKKLREIRENRVERIIEMLDRLKEHGVEISLDKVLAKITTGSVGRMHLARVMVEQNVVGTLAETFEKYIGDDKPCYAPHKRVDYRDAIKLIRNAGGVPVLAHPGTMGKDEYIPDYVKAGLRGIEVFHTRHRPGVSDAYTALSKKYGLLVTGGSDCHGTGKNEILMGKVEVGYDIVEKLREEAEKIRETRK